MQSLIKNISLLSLVVFFILSCNEKETIHIDQKGSVAFSVNDNGSQVGRTAGLTPSVVSYKFVHESGETSEGTLELFSFGKSYTTQSLTLKTGSYTLEEFIILNESKEVIYATPKKGSEFDYLVNDPLPFGFDVQAQEELNLAPEVVETEGHTPEQFGYLSFSFKPVTVQEILIKTYLGVDDYYEQMYVPFTYILTVSAKDSSKITVWEHEFELTAVDAGMNIRIPDGFEYYSFVASKADYLDHPVYFSDSDLKELSEIAFDLIPDTDDFIIQEEAGFRFILAADPCKTYARIDIPEYHQLLYGISDKSAMDQNGIIVGDIKLVECFEEANTYCGNTVNVFQNSPYNFSENFCEAINSENTAAEIFDDITFSYYFYLEYLPNPIDGGQSKSVNYFYSQVGL